MDEDVKLKLWQAKSVGEMLRILTEQYDLDNAHPGQIVKNLLISGLASAIKMVNPKRR